ncbi:MAG TPA: NAD(P)-dependent oxidoreductase [Vicinamibacterales bacterium]|nr:NAD(P)-dependent oxidoreductase [Vicinamibacterales bacterium]
MNVNIGFIGIGAMGQPMALNLARAGRSLIVWSRAAEKCRPLHEAGAEVATDPAGVFARSDVVITMLFDETAFDQVLQRGTPGFPAMVRDHIVINMSSVAPQFARALARDVQDAGGRYVEAPVSGSRIPAEQGQLLAMLGGDESLCAEMHDVLAPMCAQQVYCGQVGNGLLMKLAINIFMLCSSVGLAEAYHFAERQGLPMDRFRDIADASQMASQLSRIKLAKLIAADFAKQGSVLDGVNNTALITGAARDARASAEMITAVQRLFNEAFALGHGADDMIAVIRAMEARSRRLEDPS